MKAITLIQPWATGVLEGMKEYETRGWRTSYRGPLAIHAGKKLDLDAAIRLMGDLGVTPLRHARGAVVCVVDLVDVIEMTEDFIAKVRAQKYVGEREIAWGDWRPGRYAFKLAPRVHLIHPIPAQGALNLWEWKAPHGVEEAYRAAVHTKTEMYA